MKLLEPRGLPDGVSVLYVASFIETQEDADRWAYDYIKNTSGVPISLDITGEER